MSALARKRSVLPLAALAMVVGTAVSAPMAVCHAEEPTRVTVVAGARGAMARRLSQELEAAGLSVTVEADRPTNASKTLVIVLPEGDAGAIEIWADVDGHAKVVATVSPEGTRDARALRAAELVRALAVGSLSESTAARGEPGQSANGASSKSPAVPPNTHREDRSSTPQHPVAKAEVAGLDPRRRPPPLVDIGAAIGLGVQSQGPSMEAQGSLRVWPIPRFGVGILAELPIVAAEVVAHEGSASVRPWSFGAEIEAAPFGRDARWSLIVSPGAAFVYAAISGDARAPFVATNASAFAAMFFARAEVRLRITNALQLTLGALGGVALPPLEIRFAHRAVSTFGPHAALSLGVIVEP